MVALSSNSNMSESRLPSRSLVQHILLVESERANFASMRDRLVNLDGYQLERISDLNKMPTIVEVSKPNILILSVDTLDNVDLAPLAWLKAKNPIPVVIFAKRNYSNAVKSVLSLGVSSYIVDDVPIERLPLILDLAFERFFQMQSLSNELAQTKKKLAERKLIEKAKGIVMRQKGCGEDQAYIEMRKAAMNQGKSIAELAARIITMFDEILD